MTKHKEVIFAEPNEQADIPHAQAYRDLEHPEYIRVYYKKGIVKEFVGIKCNKHLECNCFLNDLFYLFSKIKTPKSKEILVLGKPIKIEKYVTRFLTLKNGKPIRHNQQYKVYGLVDVSVENKLNEMWKQVRDLRNEPWDRNAVNVLDVLKEIEVYQRKHGHKINSAMSDYLGDYSYNK